MASARILIVEDDPDILEIIHYILESEGFSVVTARNGKEALETLEKIEPPNLILLDLMMPVMSGEEFLRVWNASPKKRSPILILSAGNVPSLPGVSGFVKKPIDLDSLIKVVLKHCEF